jgi:flagellar motility protein MotE (MotC chaperone)
MAKKDKTGGNDKKNDKEKKEGNKILTILISLLIVVIWLAIFGILIKFDIGGFGSGVLRPILKDVPVINLILPDVSDEQIADENSYEYNSLPEAIAKIKELEAEIDTMDKNSTDNSTQVSDLQAEVDRLKVFEDNQAAFEERVKEFDKNVVFADQAPDITEYQKYYEAINPTTAEEIYRQVIEQLQYSDAIKEKADIYKSMDPKAAASILETMTADIESVAQILLSMKPKESAVILAEMDSVMAAKITKKMLDMDAEKLSN